MEIRRDFYLNKLIKRKNNGMIKVITGIRRCGKSYLLNNLFYHHLLESVVINRSCAKGKADCSLEGVVIPSKWIIICLCFLHGTY